MSSLRLCVYRPEREQQVTRTHADRRDLALTSGDDDGSVGGGWSR